MWSVDDGCNTRLLQTLPPTPCTEVWAFSRRAGGSVNGQMWWLLYLYYIEKKSISRGEYSLFIHRSLQNPTQPHWFQISQLQKNPHVVTRGSFLGVWESTSHHVTCYILNIGVTCNIILKVASKCCVGTMGNVCLLIPSPYQLLTSMDWSMLEEEEQGLLDSVIQGCRLGIWGSKPSQSVCP